MLALVALWCNKHFLQTGHVPQPTLGSLLPGWKQSTVLLVVGDGSDGVHAGLEFLCRCAEIIMNPMDSTRSVTGTF